MRPYALMMSMRIAIVLSSAAVSTGALAAVVLEGTGGINHQLRPLGLQNRRRQFQLWQVASNRTNRPRKTPYPLRITIFTRRPCCAVMDGNWAAAAW